MRRLQETVPGTMEYLIAACIEWACERGYQQMVLGQAPPAGQGDDAEDTPDLTEAAPLGRWRISSPERLLQRSVAYLHRRGVLLGNYPALYFFKQKFHPVWAPRYLVVEDASALPRAE